MSDGLEMNEDTIDFNEFQEWLDHIAKGEGTSPQSVLNDLVSTYWIINELTEEIDVDVDSPADIASGNDSEETPSEVVEAIKAVAEMTNDRETGRSKPAVTDTRSLLGALGNDGASHTSADQYEVIRLEHRLLRAEDQLDDITAELSSLQNDVESLSAVIEDIDAYDPTEIEHRQEALQEVVNERIDWVEEMVDSLYIELRESLEDKNETVDGLSQSVTNLEDRTSRLGNEFESERRERRNQQERLTRELEDHVESAQERTDKQFATMRASFQDALDEIEEHLQSVYDREETMDARLDDVIDVLDERLETLFRDQAEKRALDSLLHRAQTKGIRSASCQSCERDVDLDLLSTPHCPHCDRTFGDIESSSFLWRTNHELTTLRPGYEFDTKSITSLLEDSGDNSDEEPADPVPSDSMPDLSILDSE